MGRVLPGLPPVVGPHNKGSRHRLWRAAPKKAGVWQYECKRKKELCGTTCSVVALRCCLCCIDRCLMFLTNYAFINVAITGKSFCPAAHAAMELVAKYPVQLALDAFASSVVYWVAVLVVPTTNVVITYALIPTAWGACGSFVAVCFGCIWGGQLRPFSIRVDQGGVRGRTELPSRGRSEFRPQTSA